MIDNWGGEQHSHTVFDRWHKENTKHIPKAIDYRFLRDNVLKCI